MRDCSLHTRHWRNRIEIQGCKVETGDALVQETSFARRTRSAVHAVARILAAFALSAHVCRGLRTQTALIVDVAARQTVGVRIDANGIQADVRSFGQSHEGTSTHDAGVSDRAIAVDLATCRTVVAEPDASPAAAVGWIIAALLRIAALVTRAWSAHRPFGAAASAFWITHANGRQAHVREQETEPAATTDAANLSSAAVRVYIARDAVFATSARCFREAALLVRLGHTDGVHTNICAARLAVPRPSPKSTEFPRLAVVRLLAFIVSARTRPAAIRNAATRSALET